MAKNRITRVVLLVRGAVFLRFVIRCVSISSDSRGRIFLESLSWLLTRDLEAVLANVVI